MRNTIGTFLVISAFAHFSHAQTNSSGNRSEAGAPTTAPAPVPDTSSDSYTVFNATAEQEAALRAQIRLMHPDVLPLRVFFVSHWKYLAAARDFHLHAPTGYSSLMFTHLPSRTVFIDNDRYAGENWLGHWIAHELGHLASSAKEADAEKFAREYRKRLKDVHKADAHCDCGRITATRNDRAFQSGRRRRAVRRWPPSAAQTARAVFPHAAFTKTHDLRCKERQTPSGPFLHPSGGGQLPVSSDDDVRVFR